MLQDLLLAYYRNTGCKPQKIMYNCGGVGDRQHFDILQTEMKALRTACLSMEDDYLLPVTFVVVNKRHHMRGFLDHETDRSGNVVPDMVINNCVVDAHRVEFYLYGHSGIQGTNAPT